MDFSITDARVYERLVSGVRDYAIFVLSPDGTVRSWNIGAQLIKGYRPEEIIGRHFSLFYPREAVEQKWPEYELRTAAVEGRFEDEGWRVRKDGSRFWANVVITALRGDDGELVGFSKVTRDLTARRGFEERLRQSEERFRLLIEGVQDYAIFMLDNEGVISSWNSGAQRITGYASWEVLGRHFSRFHPEDDVHAGTPWQHLKEARKSGRFEEEGWRMRVSGERFWARVLITAVYDGEGNPQGYAVIIQDMTERRSLKELEDTARHMNEFIAMLAHELRNPLTPILHALEVIERLPGEDPANRQAMLEIIARQVRQLARIVDDLSDINRIARGTFSIERKELDLSEVVDRSIEAVRPLVEAAEHRLTVNLPASSLRVMGDAYRLTQVLSNVLRNACRYSDRGGRIDIAASEVGYEVVISVRDTGRGIAPEDIERIFNLFEQGSVHARENARGLGIGLSLSRRLIEMHGGTITAESEGIGKGSVFHIRLPKGFERRDFQPPRETGAASATPACRVLIVEDHVDAARMLEILLQSEGHETRVVHDGASALQAADDFRPDLVFLDIGIPSMNGYEVARRLREREALNPFIVALTGWGQPSDIEESRQAGFDVHIVKPVDLDSVRRILQTNAWRRPVSTST